MVVAVPLLLFHIDGLGIVLRVVGVELPGVQRVQLFARAEECLHLCTDGFEDFVIVEKLVILWRYVHRIDKSRLQFLVEVLDGTMLVGIVVAENGEQQPLDEVAEHASGVVPVDG